MWPHTPQGADAFYKELTGRGFYTGLMVSIFWIIIHVVVNLNLINSVIKLMILVLSKKKVAFYENLREIGPRGSYQFGLGDQSAANI